jgi:hypothetical protein
MSSWSSGSWMTGPPRRARPLSCWWITFTRYRCLLLPAFNPRLPNAVLQVGRVVQQLQSRPYFLFLYLDALMDREPHMASAFADIQARHLCTLCL